MKLDITVITLACICILFSCNSNSKDKVFIGIFDTTAYKLVSTQYDSSGKKYFELYKYNSDTTHFYIKNFWENGNVQALIFFNGNKKFGPAKTYDEKGDLIFEGTYINNVANGVQLYYNAGKLSNFFVYYNGKELPIDSAEKKMIFR